MKSRRIARETLNDIAQAALIIGFVIGFILGVAAYVEAILKAGAV